MKDPIKSNIILPENRPVFRQYQTLLRNGTYIIRIISDQAEIPPIEISLAKYYNLVDVIQSQNRYNTLALVIEIETSNWENNLYLKKFAKYSREKNALALCQRSVQINDRADSLIDQYFGINISLTTFIKISEISVRPDSTSSELVFGTSLDSDLGFFPVDDRDQIQQQPVLKELKNRF